VVTEDAAGATGSEWEEPAPQADAEWAAEEAPPQAEGIVVPFATHRCLLGGGGNVVGWLLGLFWSAPHCGLYVLKLTPPPFD
jgi:hypothetical protein